MHFLKYKNIWKILFGANVLWLPEIKLAGGDSDAAWMRDMQGMLRMLAFIVKEEEVTTLVAEGQTIWREEKKRGQVQIGGHAVIHPKNVTLKRSEKDILVRP